MIVLGIDTAHAACCVCVLDAEADVVLSSISESMQAGHAERLPDMVKQALGDADIDFKDVHRLAACSGPGTFTGVRIGLAFVRGLALALKIPAMGITSLQAIAAACRHNHEASDVWVVQDARRGQVYLQGFDASGAEVGPAAAIDVNEATILMAGRTGVIVGTGAGLLTLPATMRAIETVEVGNAVDIARLAARAQVTAYPPEPFYLRAPDAKAQGQLVRHQTAAVSIDQVSSALSEMLSQIHAQCFEIGWSEASIRSLLDTPGAVAFLATDNELAKCEACGFALVRGSADELEILTIAVLPHKRRRKVGAALMGAISDHARSEGATAIFIEYEDGNEAAAGLYKASGYDHTGRRKDYYRHSDGTAQDAITARLMLAAGQGNRLS